MTKVTAIKIINSSLESDNDKFDFIYDKKGH